MFPLMFRRAEIQFPHKGCQLRHLLIGDFAFRLDGNIKTVVGCRDRDIAIAELGAQPAGDIGCVLQGGNEDGALIDVDEIMAARRHEARLHNAIPAPDVEAHAPSPCPMGIDDVAHGEIDPALFKSSGDEITLPGLVGNLLPMLQLAAAAFHVVFAEGFDALG